MKQFKVYGDSMQIYTEACIIWLADRKLLLEDDVWREGSGANKRQTDVLKIDIDMQHCLQALG